MLATAGALAFSTATLRAGTIDDCDFDGIPDNDELTTETLHWTQDFQDAGGLDPIVLEGLWRLNLLDDCETMNGENGQSDTPFGHLAFNSETSCNFEFGYFNSSATFTSEYYLPAGLPSASLRWWSFMDGEDCGFDNGSVEVRGEVDSGWTTVYFDCEPTHPWEPFSADLSPWIGQRINIRFRFDTVDGIINHFLGWAVDDVSIYTLQPDCNENGLPDGCEEATIFSSRRTSPSFVDTGGSATFHVRFSEPITGLDGDAFVVNVITGDITYTGITVTQVGDTEYDVSVDGVEGNGVFEVLLTAPRSIETVDDGSPLSLYGDLCFGKYPPFRRMYFYEVGCQDALDAMRARILDDNGVRVTSQVPDVFYFDGGSSLDDDVCGTDGGQGEFKPARDSALAGRPRGGGGFSSVSGIADGGEDLFDCGNLLQTELLTSGRGGSADFGIPYTFGEIVDGTSYFGPGSRYMTVKVPGLFMMGATGITVDQFWVEGNMGSDGEGDTSVGTGFAYGQEGRLYGYFYRHWFEDENCDAQQTQAFVWATSEKAPQPDVDWNATDTDDQYQEIGGLQGAGVTEVYYFNVAHWDPSCGGDRPGGPRTPQFDNETLEAIMGEFISYLGTGDCDTSCTTAVESIRITGSSPTNADLVGFEVTFTTSVTGFDPSDVVVMSGGPTFSSVNVSGGPQVWTVEVDGVAGDGTLGSGVLDDGAIQDTQTSETLCNEQLEGESYLIDNTVPVIVNCPVDVCAPCNFNGKGGPALDYPFVPAVIEANEYQYTVEPPGPYGLNDGYPHEVTVTVTDAAGNSATCNYMVRVREFFLDPIRSYSDAQRDGHVLAGVPTAVPPIQPVATATGDIFYVGDNSQKRQYAGFVHFQTGNLPAVENIRRVTVGLTRVTSAGNVNTLGNIAFDMAVPAFGASDALAGEDLEAPALGTNVMFPAPYPAGNTDRTYWELAPEFWGALASESSVQFRVRFDNPTDNDNANDYLAFRSGNTTNLREAPVMIIEYVDPNCVEYPEEFLPEGGDPQTVVLYSTPNEDGYVQEYHATVGMGGSFDRGSGSFQVGDMANGRGLFGILNFDTGSLPFNAVILNAELRMYCTSVIGNPNETMGPLIAQMRLPFLYDAPFYFGSNLLTMADDYEAHAHNDCAVTFPTVRRNQYVTAPLNHFAILSLNRFGPTQFKVRWTQEGDGDPFADQATLLTGNSIGSPTARPALFITYVLGQGPGRPDPKDQVLNPYGHVAPEATAAEASN